LKKDCFVAALFAMTYGTINKQTIVYGPKNQHKEPGFPGITASLCFLFGAEFHLDLEFFLLFTFVHGDG